MEDNIEAKQISTMEIPLFSWTVYDASFTLMFNWYANEAHNFGAWRKYRISEASMQWGKKVKGQL
jgi:hypothetical protein